jgi:hypothetical protein
MNLEDMLGRVPSTRLEVGYFVTVHEAGEWLKRPVTATPASLEAHNRVFRSGVGLPSDFR